MRSALFVLILVFTASAATAQVAPTQSELAAYTGLHAAAARGDVAAIETLVRDGADREAVDARSRTPLHVAAFQKRHEAARTLMRLGADPNRLEIDRYDIVTIASVANDVPMLKVAIEGGGNPRACRRRKHDGSDAQAEGRLLRCCDKGAGAGGDYTH